MTDLSPSYGQLDEIRLNVPEAKTTGFVTKTFHVYLKLIVQVFLWAFSFLQ